MPLLFTASISLTPADIHPASSPHSKKQRRTQIYNRLMERASVFVWMLVLACGVWLRACVCGVPMDLVLDPAWSFAFFHLSCYLQHCTTPYGPQSNSVKSQVRHKLIIGHLRIIALDFLTQLYKHKCAKTYAQAHTEHAYSSREHTCASYKILPHTSLRLNLKRRPRSRKKVWNSITQNYWAGWRGGTFNGQVFEYKNFLNSEVTCILIR